MHYLQHGSLRPLEKRNYNKDSCLLIFWVSGKKLYYEMGMLKKPIVSLNKKIQLGKKKKKNCIGKHLFAHKIM